MGLLIFLTLTRPPLTQAQSPLIATPPDYAHWQITVTHPEPKPVPGQPKPAEKPVFITAVEVTKGPATARLIQRWSHGKTTEAWIAAGYLLKRYPALPDIHVSKLDDSTSASQGDGIADFRRHYPGFEWLAPKYFDSTLDRDGRPCLYYLDQANDRAAWVDAATKRPVAHRRGAVIHSYTFLPAPAAEPEMPDNFKQELAIYQKADALYAPRR